MPLGDPAYYLQILDRDKKPIMSPMRPLKGRHGSVDLPLVETCVEEVLKRLDLFDETAHSEPFIQACLEEIAKRKIFFFRKQSVHDGIMAAIRDTPLATTPVGQAVREGVIAAIQRLKDDASLLV